MNEADQVRVRHILDAARQAVGFIRGRTQADLNTEPMLQHGLVRLPEIIGEAARGVSADGRDAHPQLPWRRMIGMRDRLIHGYFDVDPEVVWQTVTEDLPPLIGQLEELLG